MKLSSHPKNLEYRPIYQPDMTRMVKALKILHEYKPNQDGKFGKKDASNNNKAQAI